MKKIILLVIIVIIALLVTGLVWWQYSGNDTNTNSNPNSNTNASPDQPENDWTTYENARYSFSVDYPAGWEMGEAPTNNDGREFISPDKTMSCRAYGFFNALTDEEGNPQALDEFIEWMKSNEEGEVIETKSTLLDGVAAQNLVTRSLDGKVTDAVYALGIESGRGLYCIFESEQAQQDFKDSFNKMVTSFNIDVSLDGEDTSTLPLCLRLTDNIDVPLKGFETFEDENYTEVTLTSRDAWDQDLLPSQVTELEGQGYTCYPMPSEYSDTTDDLGVLAQPEVTKVLWSCELPYEDYYYIESTDSDDKVDLENQGYTCQKDSCVSDDNQVTFVWLCTK